MAKAKTSALERFMAATTQGDRAEIYNGFVAKYNTNEKAQEALDTGDPDLIECVLVAYTVDAMRKAAERAGKTKSAAKSAAARANGAKGGRPRKNPLEVQESPAIA